jgi:hypothetical protein
MFFIIFGKRELLRRHGYAGWRESVYRRFLEYSDLPQFHRTLSSTSDEAEGVAALLSFGSDAALLPKTIASTENT